MGLGSSVDAFPKCGLKLSTKPVCPSQKQQLQLNPQTPVPSEPRQHHFNGTMTNGTIFQPQCSGVYSSVVSGSTVPVGGTFVEYTTALSNNWESMEATPLACTTRSSRPRHRHLFDNRLNNSFAEGNMMGSGTDSRINDIRRVEENLRMESRMLSENNNIPMARCSTPSPAYCFHCDHDHRERCCLYVGDTPEDGPYYSRWKRDLENPTVRPQYIPKIPEAVSGNSTPFWFPAYTYTKPEAIKQKMLEKNPPPPAVWMRQYYYPIVGYGHEYQLMNQATVEPPTPYQQYLQQHQQELNRMYQQQQQQQQQVQQHRENAACRHGRKCEASVGTIGHSGAPYIQQQPQQQQFHNIQVPGEYVPQLPPTPYYYQGSYYNGHHHHQQYPQQNYASTGFASVTPGSIPIYHDGYLHPSPYAIGYATQTAVASLPPREPTPPSPTTSTPLWLLFCQKLSRKFPDRSKKSSPTKGRSPSKNFPHHHMRHNPTTVVPPTVLAGITPDYLPPTYTTIDHPQMQYQGGIQQSSATSYIRPTVVTAHHGRMGQNVASHPPFYSHHLAAAPMTDVGMYYVSPATINI